jgi:hypothetical protein
MSANPSSSAKNLDSIRAQFQKWDKELTLERWLDDGMDDGLLSMLLNAPSEMLSSYSRWLDEWVEIGPSYAYVSHTAADRWLKENGFTGFVKEPLLSWPTEHGKKCRSP